MTIGIEPEVEELEEEPVIEIVAEPRVEAEELQDEYGKFVAEPLERGFGATLGNALRRVLLNSLVGSAVHAIRIDGIEHEYSTMKDIREDVTELILNIKGVRLRGHSDRPGTLRLEVQGPGQVTAGDIQPSADYAIVNPETSIASLDSAEAKLAIELYVDQGTGYTPATPVEGAPIGVLPVDAIYTPIRRVNYNVEKTRVGQVTDYEKLTIEIWTDGSKAPMESMQEAAELLIESFQMFAGLGKETELGLMGSSPDIPREQYDMAIEKLDLSARTLNCLKRSKIDTVGGILEKTRDELLRIKNFGEKSLVELDERLLSIGVSREGEEDGVPSEVVGELESQSPALSQSGDPDGDALSDESSVAAQGVDKEDGEGADKESEKGSGEPIKDLSALRALLGEEAKDITSEDQTK